MTEPIKQINGTEYTPKQAQKIEKLQAKISIWETKIEKTDNDKNKEKFSKKLERLEDKIQNLYTPQISQQKEDSPFDKQDFLLEQLYGNVYGNK